MANLVEEKVCLVFDSIISLISHHIFDRRSMKLNVVRMDLEVVAAFHMLLMAVLIKFKCNIQMIFSFIKPVQTFRSMHQ